jgi:peptidoglycan/xylan/chitin deacetylase (PgdA/CDA1 family)
MTDKLLSVIGKHQVPVVGFVNESLLYVRGETDERIEILRSWADAGVELANHTFSHLRFKDISLAEYQDDFIRGETLIRDLMKQRGRRVRYFRHPYLQMGTTQELEKAFQVFLANRGYQSAPVTIDSMDWMFLAAYADARTRGDLEMSNRVSEEYLRFVELRLDFSEKASTELFGRQIRHILLLHANELNAENLDKLLTIIKGRGFQFVTLEHALQDPIYRFPDKYIDSSDWLFPFAAPRPPEFIQKAFERNQ